MNKPDEKRQGMQVRKVVTGHDADGRAVIARDEKIDGMPIPGLGELVFLWSADEPATYPNSGDNPAAPALFPPVGGIASSSRRTRRGSKRLLHQKPLPGYTSRRATNPACTRPTRRISGPSLRQRGTRARRWRRGVPVSRRCRGAERNSPPLARGWGTCRPPWLLSSSEPTAVRFRPARDVAIAMTPEDRCGYRRPILSP